MQRFLLRLIGLLIGILAGILVLRFYDQRQAAAEQIQPLKVTIIDDGGADLKVESTVVEPKK